MCPNAVNRRDPSRGMIYEYMLIYSITQGTIMKTSADLKAEILLALAHPNRIRIVELLRKDVMCNCELAPALELEQSNLSRHLKILVQAGILRSWKKWEPHWRKKWLTQTGMLPKRQLRWCWRSCRPARGFRAELYRCLSRYCPPP